MTNNPDEASQGLATREKQTVDVSQEAVVDPSLAVGLEEETRKPFVMRRLGDELKHISKPGELC